MIKTRQAKNVELGRGEVVALQTAPSNAVWDVPGASIIITEGDRPYNVEFTAQQLGTSVAGVNCNALITDGANAQIAAATINLATASTGFPIAMKATISNPVPGTQKTYKVRINNGGATGQPFINAGPLAKAILQATEV